ncbi:reactive intermediate/imine deaminase [Hephaestia caeni]|uniref:Reactive intermediate/imine deaminase n=1 Tax=Hephaestia caeni TaxID=645617 RepID=A0A397NK48_9SPHN|nr:RidA family protein [Hephaestia caeni]RIA37932.1 reactive intermediate/imine deaminase [Hephaestia caeni]
MTAISDVDYIAHPDPRLPFSAAVRVGDVVHLSGQIGVREDGTLPNDIAGQTHQAMRNLADAATRAGTSLDRVVKCTVMLADMALWPEFNRAYLTCFDRDRLPARSAFGTSGLAFGALVEVEAIAVAGAVAGGKAGTGA